jgi:hypothetical protein
VGRNRNRYWVCNAGDNLKCEANQCTARFQSFVRSTVGSRVPFGRTFGHQETQDRCFPAVRTILTTLYGAGYQQFLPSYGEIIGFNFDAESVATILIYMDDCRSLPLRLALCELSVVPSFPRISDSPKSTDRTTFSLFRSQ